MVEMRGTIKIPEHVVNNIAKKYYPIQVKIELSGTEKIDFEVMLVYEEA